METKTLTIDNLDEMLEWTGGSIWTSLIRRRVKGIIIGEMADDSQEVLFVKFGETIAKDLGYFYKVK